jgi:hypothetical protein
MSQAVHLRTAVSVLRAEPVPAQGVSGEALPLSSDTRILVPEQPHSRPHPAFLFKVRFYHLQHIDIQTRDGRERCSGTIRAPARFLQ